MRARAIKKQSGQVIVVFAICMVVLIGAVGVAVDSGMGYMSKAKLNAAVDAAAIAAARAVTKGSTQAEQTADATRAANEFFAANFVNDPMKSQPVLNKVSVAYASNGRITFDLDASSKIPTTFTRVLGFNELNIKANAETIRRDLDLSFVIDTSGSMSDTDVQSRVREASKSFLGKLNQVTDRVSLIQFANGAMVHEPFKADQSRGFNRARMNAAISNFDFEGSTNSAEALWHARNQLKNVITKPSSLRVIVFFSDGSPNSYSSLFQFNPASNCVTPAKPALTGTLSTSDSTSYANGSLYGMRVFKTVSGAICEKGSQIAGPNHVQNLPEYYNAHDAEGATKNEFRITAPRVVNTKMTDEITAWRSINRASRNLAENIAKKARQEGVFVFTIGLGPYLVAPAGPDLEKGETFLKCLANANNAGTCHTSGEPTGLYCHALTGKELSPCFDEVASAILRITK